MWHGSPAFRPETVNSKSTGLQAIETDMCGVTLAIVMELCRLGSFYKLIEQARRVAHLPIEVRTGARCPSTPDMAKAKVTLLSLSLFPNSPLDKAKDYTAFPQALSQFSRYSCIFLRFNNSFPDSHS